MPASYNVYQSRKPLTGRFFYPSASEATASLLQSVKEQEVQFEEIVRELEAERKSVAHQIERCYFTSDYSGMPMSQIGVHNTPESNSSYRWSSLGDKSDTSFHVSGSQLVDSCLSW